MNNHKEATDILHTFINGRLRGEIEALIDFDLGQLRYDNIYGCPERRFAPDDTNLMRAIYCIVFGDVWKNLSWENSGEESYVETPSTLLPHSFLIHGMINSHLNGTLPLSW